MKGHEKYERGGSKEERRSKPVKAAEYSGAEYSGAEYSGAEYSGAGLAAPVQMGAPGQCPVAVELASVKLHVVNLSGAVQRLTDSMDACEDCGLSECVAMDEFRQSVVVLIRKVMGLAARV